MAKKAALPVVEDRVAAPGEITGAVGSLSGADWYRLKKFADYHVHLLVWEHADTEADARAKMLIYLLENKLLA